MSDRAHRRALLLLLCAALFLYFYGSAQGYRSDEVWSLQAVSGSFGSMMDTLRADIHPPLYYWLLAAWIRLVGTGEVAVRLLSILLCLGAAGLVYLAGRDWYGTRGGLFAAALFLASPLSAVVAQIARMYGLLVFTSALSTLAFLRLSRSAEVRKRDWALYVAANIAGSFTHVWFFFLLFAQGCTYLALHRTRRLGIMLAAAVASLAPYAVLWMPVLVRQVRTTEDALAWVPRPGWTDLAGAVFLLAGWFLVFAPFLWKWWRRQQPSRLPALEPALIAVLAVLVPFGVSFVKPVFWSRFTIIALPAICVAAAAFVPPAARLRVDAGLLGTACVLAVLLGFSIYGCDSRVAAEYLARNTRAGDLVVFTNLSRLPIDYYWDRLQPGRGVEERSFPREIDAHPGFVGDLDSAAARERLHREASLLTAEAAQRHGGRLFLLHGFHPDADADLKQMLDRELLPVESLGLACNRNLSYFETLSVFSCEPGELPRADVDDQDILRPVRAGLGFH